MGTGTGACTAGAGAEPAGGEVEATAAGAGAATTRDRADVLNVLSLQQLDLVGPVSGSGPYEEEEGGGKEKGEEGEEGEEDDTVGRPLVLTGAMETLGTVLVVLPAGDAKGAMQGVG